MEKTYAEFYLAHAYGYRGFDGRNNLHHNADGKLVYPTAALGVIMDPTDKS